MIASMLRLVGLRPDDEEARACGATRDPRWSGVERAWLKDHNTCACCRTKSDLQVHHKVPFHLDRSKELDARNLITFCRRCHLFVGHLGDWKAFNPHVEEDAVIWAKKFANRPLALAASIALCLSLLLFGAGHAQPPAPVRPALVVPPTVKAAPGTLVKIRAETTCKKLVWIIPAEIKPETFDFSDDGRWFNLVAPAKGPVVLWCVAAPDRDLPFPAKCIIEIEAPEPPKPPPIPPPPAPPPDTLAAELQVLYTADAKADPARAGVALAGLIRFYGEAADLAKSAQAPTVGVLMAAIMAARDKLVPPGPLPTLRARVGKELLELPSALLPLDDAARTAIVAKYERLAKALGAVK
jgi:5-methylcytosine-specific restriction protein A